MKMKGAWAHQKARQKGTRALEERGDRKEVDVCDLTAYRRQNLGH